MANWAGILNVALSAYGAYASNREKKKAAESAARGQTTVRTQAPYANEYISNIVPWVLKQQQDIFESRMGAYGFTPADSTMYRDMLNGIPQGYSGVGAPGAPIVTGGAPQATPGMAPQSPAMPAVAPMADPEVDAVLGGMSAPMGAQGAQPGFQPQAQAAGPDDGFQRYWEALA